MIHCAAMQPEDIEAGLTFCRTAGWNQLRRDWELFLHCNLMSCRVAFDEEKVIGTVATVSYEDYFGWIGMMLVAPTLRRQVLGTQLMQQALKLLQNVETVRLDATPVGREVYLKLGFVDEYRLQRLETIVSGQGLMPSTARLLRPDDWPSVQALDRNIFGADRRTVLEWVQSDGPEYAWVVDGPRGIRGYCLGRHGYNFEHLGPVVANDLETARQLVSSCLRDHVGKPFLLDAAPHNAEWLRWLGLIGFTEQRPLIRMYRGSNRFPGEPEHQFAILGPEFG